MSQPTVEILQAFGLSGESTPIPGGRGLCFRVNDIVLRPSDDDDEETQWVARLCDVLSHSPSPAYRVSRPIPVVARPGDFIFDGWTAWSLVPGKPGPNGHFEEIIRAARAFHADVARLVTEKPAFLERRTNRWSEADRVTWGEKAINEVRNVNTEMLAYFQPILDKLVSLRRPLHANAVGDQLIHADLTGNVLFETTGFTTAGTKALPGIIDITLYWRPAAYVEAIVVADGLVWHGEGHELVELYGTGETRMQLLVRALYWRCLTFAIDPDLEWAKKNIPRANNQGALDVICKVMES